MTERLVFEDAVARNIGMWRNLRRLTQKRLAARMSALGFTWRQQIVASAESGDRRVTVGEILGLALALDCTIAALMEPAEPFQPPSEDVVLPSGDTITASDVKSLLYRANTHAVTWEGDSPVFKPGGYVPADRAESSSSTSAGDR